MIKVSKNRNDEIKEIVTIVKVSSILFCIIALVANIEPDKSSIFDFEMINLRDTSIIMFMFSAIYLGISSIFEKSKKDYKFFATLIERVLYGMIFIMVIILSGAYNSDYKFIFIFLIIQTTLEGGMYEGMIVGTVSSLALLSIDLLWYGSLLGNIYFQNDIILVGVFLIVAWIMGYFITNSSKKLSELMSLVNEDALTGVYTLEYFMKSIDASIKNIKDNHKGLGIVLLDVDYFKEYNDLYGRKSGDEVLKCVGGLLRECTSGGQICSRVGGGTFGVLLNNTNLDKTILLAESIRKSINDEQFKGEEKQPNGRITVTVGVAHYPNGTNSSEEFFRSAQEALNKGKILNRNSVEVYNEILNSITSENKTFGERMKNVLLKINDRDKFSVTHIQRVVMFSKMIAKELNLSKEDTRLLIYASYMHDIGKYNIKKEILNKKTSLDDKEWQEMMKHPQYSVDLIESSNYVKEVEPIVLHHHERFDGKGYPDRLKGEEIPYLARILTVVDAFDAMTSYRPYNVIKTNVEAIEELKANAGTQFDPKIVDAFIKMFN